MHECRYIKMRINQARYGWNNNISSKKSINQTYEQHSEMHLIFNKVTRSPKIGDLRLWIYRFFINLRDNKG